MSETTEISGGINIAMKVPSHLYAETVAFYRDVLKLNRVPDRSEVGFLFGPNQLWIDEAPGHSQSEVWLELFAPELVPAAAQLSAAGITRNDAIEPLGEGFRGGWFFNPAGIVHMVREPDAW